MIIAYTHAHKEQEMAKTPYEIRLETLQLAFDIVNNQKTATNNNSGIGNYTAPTTDEVIKEGLRLREFIDAEQSIQLEKFGFVPERRTFYIESDLTEDQIKITLEEKQRELFVEKLKTDGSACCGGTGNNCECNS